MYFENRNLYNYIVHAEYEAGVVLLGTEVKAIRENSIDLTGSFIRFNSTGLCAYNIHIKQYSQDKSPNYKPTRERQLLLKLNELHQIKNYFNKEFLCVPISLYFNAKGKLKAKIAIVKSKNLADKRQYLKEKQEKRENRE